MRILQNSFSLIVYLLWLSMTSTVSAQRKTAPAVFDYYLRMIDSTHRANYIFRASTDFEVSVRSIYVRLDSRGRFVSADTAGFRLLFAADSMSALEILDSTDEPNNTPPEIFDFEPPTGEAYRYNFFPNDTGAGILAIGFEPPEEKRLKLPSGLITFERNSYRLSHLVLYYDEKKGYQRYSEVFKFGTFEEFQVLERMQINAAREGLIRNIYYKMNYEFYDYRRGKR